MVETSKRSVDDGGLDGLADAKKPRLDTTDGASKPDLSAKLAQLEKAKRALQLQKELKEKLKKLPQLQGQTAAPAATAANIAVSAPDLLAAGNAKAAQIAARFGLTMVPGPPSSTMSAPPPLTVPAAVGGRAPLHAAIQLPHSQQQGAGGAGFRPAPLRLDAAGREVDEFGNLVTKTAMPVVTLKVNQHLGGQGRGQGGAASVLPPPPSSLPPPPQQPAEPAPDAFFDPSMGQRGLAKLARKPRPNFEFVHKGEFQRQAEAFRLRARYGRDSQPAAAAPRLPRGPIGPQGAEQAGGFNPNLMPLGEPTLGSAAALAGARAAEEAAAAAAAAEPPEVVPEVEWWDRALLASGSYEADVEQPLSQGLRPTLKEAKITLFVEHPVPLEPPSEAPPPPPQPLKLTAKELKKMRTQRRQAREKEKQDLIRQGLLEPPKAKVKLSNLYRVLGEQAVADPTMLELETKKQMQERQAAHDDRNLSRALTPAERKEKKLRKLFDDNGLEVLTSVYRIGRLDSKLNKIKVDINARENHMSGTALIAPDFSLVVVEGCRKATKRYAKLMLRRIDWQLQAKSGRGHGGPAGGEEGEEGEDEDTAPNTCDLVWQGVVKKAAFEGFKMDTCSTQEHAQQVLAMRGVSHYWDAAKNFVPGETGPAPEIA